MLATDLIEVWITLQHRAKLTLPLYTMMKIFMMVISYALNTKRDQHILQTVNKGTIMVCLKPSVEINSLECNGVFIPCWDNYYNHTEIAEDYDLLVLTLGSIGEKS